MRAKQIAAVIPVVLMMVAGCARQSSITEMENANMAIVRQIHAEVAKGNTDVFGRFLALDYVRHCQAMPPAQQEIHGHEPLTAFVSEFLTGVSNFSEVFNVMMADSDKVAYVTTMHGTHSGDMNGVPATGREFSIVNIIIHRFENGRIAETWVSWDNLAMLRQLGLLPDEEGGSPAEAG